MTTCGIRSEIGARVKSNFSYGHRHLFKVNTNRAKLKKNNEVFSCELGLRFQVLDRTVSCEIPMNAKHEPSLLLGEKFYF